MKYLFFILACTAVLGQEGRAIRPAPEPICNLITTSGAAIESCTFGKYRFTYGNSPELFFEVYRMESGNYLSTTLDAALKPGALKQVIRRIQKDARRRSTAGEPCTDVKISGADDLILKFERRHAYFELRGQDCKARAGFNFAELNSMLK